MNISKKMQDAFNKQIAAEFWSSNLYLSMAFWFRKEGWKGFAGWMFRQSAEEKEHALDMAEYVLNRGGEVKVTAIDAVQTEWADAKTIFEETLKHEQLVTEYINALADVADEEKDRASQNFIGKYIDEQVEEEKSVKDILDLFKQQDEHAIAHIERQLAQG
ncbi:MAG: ferritin [Prevotella sp.]|nr:ferritin [Prevotella sp.]MDD7272529.1 ferritin [Prevotellaceae bacterium]MDY3936689.1 ferritin [Prevotella sp.]MDY4217904.1 ferritin [Prevotella sp.]